MSQREAKLSSGPYPSVFVGVDMAATGGDRSAIAIRSGAEIVMVADSGPSGPNIMAAWINGFSARRKADREALVLAITAIIQVRGGTVERREKTPTPGYSGAGIDLSISLNGVGAMIGISDLHGGGFALISWHNTEYPSRNFTSTFCVKVGEFGNHRPHHKATSHPRDWYSLAMFLDAGLYLAARGEAFEPAT